LAQGARAFRGKGLDKFLDHVELVHQTLKAARPTAIDPVNAMNRVRSAMQPGASVEEQQRLALAGAEELANTSVGECREIGRHGANLIQDGMRVLTHCNAGWLACVDWGTALSPVYAAKRQGKKIFVYIDETRPRLQGARLTSWELMNEGVPHAVIADNAAGHYMYRKEINLVIVGADRIAANGDVVNKIGTYEKAVVARDNKIPFYVAAPTSTIDLSRQTGDEIPIEERDESEVHIIGKERITPAGSKAKNPAFDVTPAKFVTGIITENGILEPSEIKDFFAKE
jgi:S-methyl-5-thioribose-1-phosphate isomerase